MPIDKVKYLFQKQTLIWQRRFAFFISLPPHTKAKSALSIKVICFPFVAVLMLTADFSDPNLNNNQPASNDFLFTELTRQ
jgi:hypothetical protein